MTGFEEQFYNYLLVLGLLIGAAVFLTLFFITAPYGRHTSARWGPTVNNTLGWVLMELPASVGFAFFFLLGARASVNAGWLFLLIWEVHYVHRSLIFPFRLKAKGKRMPVLIVLFAVIFNLWNTYLNGRYIGLHTAQYTVDWLTDPRFIMGLGLFVAGFTINIQSDNILLRLRKTSEGGYQIPKGGAYRWLSCPNYFGEILEWWGWALATWSLPGLCFALWTMANLVPRARANHRWYQETFPEYPPNRKAVFPCLF